MRKFPMSFSRLSTFEQCAQKFDYLYVSKSVQDIGSEHTHFGTRVHESLEKYARSGGDEKELTIETQAFKPLVDKILSVPGDKYFEYQMALDANKTPCDWFSQDVWLRGIADVLVVDGEVGYIVDWKSGKVKDNPTQLQLFALMVFAHFPQVQRVRSGFVWLKHDEVTMDKYGREHADALWRVIAPRFDRAQEAIELGVFKAKPSRLCGWCPAKDICGSAWR